MFLALTGITATARNISWGWELDIRLMRPSTYLAPALCVGGRGVGNFASKVRVPRSVYAAIPGRNRCSGKLHPQSAHEGSEESGFRWA